MVDSARDRCRRMSVERVPNPDWHLTDLARIRCTTRNSGWSTPSASTATHHEAL